MEFGTKSFKQDTEYLLMPKATIHHENLSYEYLCAKKCNSSHTRTIEIQGDLDKDTPWQGPAVRPRKNTGLEIH